MARGSHPLIGLAVGGIALALPLGRKSFAVMMNPLFSSSRLALVSLTAAALTLSCEKQESAAPAPAPVPAAATPPAAAPAATVVTDTAGSFPVTPTVPVAETSPALETFKAEVKAIKTFMEANQDTKDAAVGLANLRELVTRASAVKTEGLPGDLAEAYQAMTGVMSRIQATLDDLPVPVDQLQAYMTAETAKGAAAAQEVAAKLNAFQTAMESHQKDGEAASTKLKAVGAKYGIESLELSGK